MYTETPDVPAGRLICMQIEVFWNARFSERWCKQRHRGENKNAIVKVKQGLPAGKHSA
jgi:hypothetical protein